MAANKNLYVAETDLSLWNQIEELTGEKPSAIVAQLLRTEVEKLLSAKKAKEGKCARIVVAYCDENDVKRKVAFVGRWIVENYCEAHVEYSVALTENERLFVLINKNGCGFHCVYDTFGEMEATDLYHVGPYPAELLAIVAEAIGEDFVEELDI